MEKYERIFRAGDTVQERVSIYREFSRVKGHTN